MPSTKIAELERNLDARQLARDEAKRGPKGLKGERGHRGDPGPPGEPAKTPLIGGSKIDSENFRAVPFGPDGKPLPELNLLPLFQAYFNRTGDPADAVREKLAHLLPKMMLSAGL